MTGQTATRYLVGGETDPLRPPRVFERDEYGSEPMQPGDILKQDDGKFWLWTGAHWLVEGVVS